MAKNILLVDDDLGILDSMKDLLETENYHVTVASNGYKAIELVESKSFNLAIVDIKMPGMGGIGVLKAFNEIDPILPVIILTGFASMETATESIRSGAYDYITKPFEWDRLLNTIKRAVEKKDLLSKNKDLLNELTQTNTNLKIKVQQLYKLNEAGNAMNTMLDIDSLLRYILNMSLQLMNAKVGSLLLFDDTNYNLSVRVARGLNSSVVKQVVLRRGEGFIGKLVEKGEIYLRIKDNSRDYSFNKKDKMILATAEDFTSFPLKTRGKVLGLLNLSNFPETVDVNSNIHLGGILSAQVATAIDNANLYKGMQTSYLNTMEILINAMEAKSKFTRGHSERVCHFGYELCRDLDLHSEQINCIKQASRLHDIGKITISDFILNKPDRLTQSEWLEIMSHPVRGAETLKPLGFLDGISPIVKFHHERFDGKGYPDGLAGKNVPLGARIIAIVDAFDAMISPRPYRAVFKKEEAKKEIEKNKGTQFDPDFVDVFLNETFPRIKEILEH